MLAVLLIAATISDIRHHRIPNLLTFGGALLALSLQTVFFGWSGLGAALGGLVIGLLCFLPFYVAGGFAAGDVKLMAAVGAFVGPLFAAYAVAATLIAGGVLAMVVLLRGERVKAAFQRYGLIIKTFFYTRKLVYIRPEQGDAATQRFPYALAILTGTMFVIWHQTGTWFGWGG